MKTAQRWWVSICIASVAGIAGVALLVHVLPSVPDDVITTIDLETTEAETWIWYERGTILQKMQHPVFAENGLTMHPVEYQVLAVCVQRKYNAANGILPPQCAVVRMNRKTTFWKDRYGQWHCRNEKNEVETLAQVGDWGESDRMQTRPPMSADPIQLEKYEYAKMRFAQLKEGLTPEDYQAIRRSGWNGRDTVTQNAP